VALTAVRAVAVRANVLHHLGRDLVPPHTPNVCSWDRGASWRLLHCLILLIFVACATPHQS